MFVTVDYGKEITSKKSFKCSKYGSFEHLLLIQFLF